MLKYSCDVSTERKWLTCERPEKLHAGMVRALFTMKRLAQMMNYNLKPDMNHEIGLYKLSQKNNPMEHSFAVQLSTKPRCIFYAVIFHVVNPTGNFLANVLDMDNGKGYEGDSAALLILCVKTVEDIILIDYSPPESFDVFIHHHVWPVLCDAILKMFMPFVLTYVTGCLQNEALLFKPPIGPELRLLLPTHQIMMKQMIGALTEPGVIANLFLTSFISFSTSELARLELLTTQEAYHA